MTAKLRLIMALCALTVGAVILPGSGALAAGTFAGANGRIVFVHREAGTHHGQIFTMDQNGQNKTQLTSSVGDDYEPTFSGDGEKIAFARDTTGFGGIWVMNSDGTGQTPLTNGTETAKDFSPAFSPDGTRIAFTRFNDGDQAHIWVMNADGTGQTQLTSGAEGQHEAAFSPSGEQIVFRRALRSEIWVMNADGSGERRLLAGSETFRSYGPTWSPDGQQIAFEGVDDDSPGGSGHHHIWTMNAADGSGLKQVTTGPSQDVSPVFSPDGTRIAFTREDSSGGLFSNIFLVDPSGSNPTPLTHNSFSGPPRYFDEYPDWQPIPDTTAPETTITKDAPNKTDKSTVKFKFSSDEPASTFECKLTGKGLKDQVQEFNSCDSPRKYKKLDPGKYNFKVRATDPAGNVDSTPAKDKFKVVG